MNGFAVRSEDLRALEVFAAAAAHRARAAVGIARAEADALFATGWQGRAATAFRAGWEEWLAGVEDVLSALESMARLVGVSAEDYAGTDDAVRAAAAGSSP